MLPFSEQQKKGLLNKKIKNHSPISKMKPGQYELHVLVQSTSGLFSGDRQEALQVIVSVQAFGKKNYSSTKSDVGYQQTFWGQHFFFQTKFDDSSVAQGQKILISVHNRKKKIYQALIGNYQLSVGTIYAHQDHCIYHRWLALSNVDFSFSQIVGYIKISVSMLGQTDKSMELDPQPATCISKQKSVMIPPNIQRKNYQLAVQIFEGEHIAAVEEQNCHPYVGVQFGHIFSKTQPAIKNTNPIFMQTVYIPISLPAVNKNIALRINDFNYVQKVQVLGSYYINITQIISLYQKTKKSLRILRKKNKSQGSQHSEKSQTTVQFVPEKNSLAVNKKLPYTQMQWINFYGPSIDSSNEQHKNIYQFFPHLAPYYVGSILMRMKLTEKDKPQRKTCKFKGSLPKQQKIYFQINASIYAAIDLYKKNKSYQVCIRVGHFQIQTDYQQAKNGFCSWNVYKTMGVSFYQNQLVPDIFVYLVDQSGQKVCFLRYQPFPKGQDIQIGQQITILQPQWIMLKPDLSRIIIQNQQAGYLRIGLKISKKQFKVTNSQKRLKSSLTQLQSLGNRGRLIIQLICAEQMLPLDEEGTSDPFFEFLYMDRSIFSTVQYETLNPIYYQKLIVQCDINSNPEKLPPLIVNAYDKDQFSRQFIGSSFINLSDGINQKWAVYGNNINPQPKWFELKQNNLIAGKFLVSFILLPQSFEQIPKSISLPCQNFVVTLLILGIRGLKKSSLIPIKNPYVIFDIDSFDAFDKNSNLATLKKQSTKKKLNQGKSQIMTQNIVTEPKQVNQILNLKLIEKRTIRLPSNPNYWPALSAKLKNDIMTDVYEPIIGYFSINLKNAYQMTQKSKQKYQKRALTLDNNGQQQDQFQKYDRLKDIDSTLLYNLRNSIIISLNYAWPVMSKQIKLNDENKAQRFDPDAVAIFPCYQQIEKGKKYQEIYKEYIADNRNYMKIGFDSNQARGKGSLLQREKHYRFVINQPLEDYQMEKTGIKMGMFDQSLIRTGRLYPSNSIADNIMKKVTDVDHYVGKYKGHCFIERQEDVENSQVDQNERNKLQSFLKNKKFHMYLYILQAFNIPDMDLFSKSDPYLIVKVGNKVMNFSDEYILDSDNPQFNKKIYKAIELPEDGLLEIQVWDWDDFISDDYIGSAIIDLQNRAFYQESNVVFNNPIQTHKLMTKQSKIPQGSIRFWLDLVPQSKHSIYREFKIGHRQDCEFQVRVVIWSCSQIPDNNIEGMSDLFVLCTFNNDTQSTDTHIRTSNGFGSFNWRCVYDVKLPTCDTFLSFRVFDMDLLTPNEYICSTTFSISHLLDEAFQTRQPQKLYIGKKDLTKYSGDSVASYKIVDGEKLYDRFQIPLQAKADGKGDRQSASVGKLQLTLEVLPKSLALKKPVGKGRDGPNQFPYLMQPKDRFQWSWNPLTLATRLCGRSFRYKLAIMFLITFIISIFYNYFHSFGGATSADIVVTTLK